MWKLLLLLISPILLVLAYLLVVVLGFVVLRYGLKYNAPPYWYEVMITPITLFIEKFDTIRDLIE